MSMTTLNGQMVAALDGSAARLPIVVGGCGSGRTALLLHLRDLRGGRRACQYVDLERIATTPERFCQALERTSPFVIPGESAREAPARPREALERSLQFLTASRSPDGLPATFLIDEVLELRTFESFPGLRSVVHEALSALASSSNRFVLATRFSTRARRLVRAQPQVEIITMLPLAPEMLRDELAHGAATPDAEELAYDVHALSDGRPAYARALVNALHAMALRGVADPVSALVGLMEPGAELHARLRFSYELRLHRARGYGALKAILDVLAEHQPLSLTEIAQRLGRTPGSTKDYLTWLEDVDLLAVARKRYSFSDPLLRIWVRLNNSSVPPTSADVAREVQQYALERLSPAARQPLPAPEEAGVGASSRGGAIIEID
jgi:hypothetical protein